MREQDETKPPADAGPVQRTVGRPAPERAEGDLSAECVYCKQRLYGWRAAEGALGKRWRDGVLEYHCYAAKALD